MSQNSNQDQSAVVSYSPGVLIYTETGVLLAEDSVSVAATNAISSCGPKSRLFGGDSWFNKITDKQIDTMSTGESLAFDVPTPEFARQTDCKRLHVRCESSSEGSRVFFVRFEKESGGNNGSHLDERFRNQILQMARLACIGSLGGPIAHALNNPLATIRGFAEVLKRRFEQIEKVAYFSDKIVTNSDRMRVTIEQLRKLSRPGTENKDAFSINEVVLFSLSLMDEQFKMRNIDLEMNLDDSIDEVAGDFTMWESLFLSMMAHSRDSFQDQNDERKKKVFVSTERKGDKVEVRYMDSAGGFPSLNPAEVTDSVEMLSGYKNHIGLAAFVLIEVTKVHKSELSIDVVDGESTELVLSLDVAQSSSKQDTDSGAA